MSEAPAKIPPDECPRCGSEVWDNREGKESGRWKERYPDFTCKDKACKWAHWLTPKPENMPLTPAPQPSSTKPGTWTELKWTYAAAETVATEHLGIKGAADPVSLALVAQSFFLGAIQTGLRVPPAVARASIAPAPKPGPAADKGDSFEDFPGLDADTGLPY